MAVMVWFLLEVEFERGLRLNLAPVRRCAVLPHHGEKSIAAASAQDADRVARARTLSVLPHPMAQLPEPLTTGGLTVDKIHNAKF